MSTRDVPRRAVLAAAIGMLTLPRRSLFAQSGRRVRRLGMLFVDPNLPEEVPPILARLAELGWVENQTLFVERAHADGERKRLPELAWNLVRNGADVISVNDFDGTLAAAQATSSIPIVFAGVPLTVEQGLIESYARPGRNITGVSRTAGVDIVTKRLGLLKEVAPKARLVAWLIPTGVIRNPSGALDASLMEAWARKAGFEPLVYPVDYSVDFDKIFKEIVKHHAEVLSVGDSGFLRLHRERIVRFGNTNRLPSAYGNESFVDAGGLLSFESDRALIARTTAEYIDRVLRGANPATMPVYEPTKFAIVLNLKTAKSLGLAIPHSLLLQADRVVD